MKRTTFLIISVVIVLILAFVWAYMLFFSTPSEDGENIFSNFNFGSQDETVVPTNGATDDVADVVVDTASQERLRQLTTVPVLAYREVRTSSTSAPLIHYVEAGTGHVYQIDYETGQTTRVSATTIPIATDAAMSPNGQFVMVRSGGTAQAEYVVGQLSSSTEALVTTSIDENVVDFVIPNDSEILYGVQLQNSYVGKRYSLNTGQTSTLFTIPFREVSVAWGEGSDSTHYAYPKATNQLPGFVYEINSGSLERLPIDGYGLSVVGSDDTMLFSRVKTTRTTREYESAGYDVAEAAIIDIPFAVLPEKCTYSGFGSYYCASPTTLQSTPNLPDSWYQGTVSFSDAIWEVLPTIGSASLIIDITNQSGRGLDVVGITPSPSLERLYFKDRHNQLLWVYELTNQTL